MLKDILNKFIVSRENSHMREVARGASRALFLRIVGTALGFLFSVVIARLLGAEGAGQFYLATSVLAVAATLSQFGFENTVVRFVASAAVGAEWKSVRFICRTSIKIVAVVSAVLAILLFTNASWLAVHLFSKKEMNNSLLLVALALMPFALSLIQTEILRGLREIYAAQLVQSVFVPLIGLLFIYPFFTLWAVNGVMMAYFLAILITSLTALRFWTQALKKVSVENINECETIKLHTLFQTSWHLLGVAFTGIVIQQAATILLGVFGTAEDVGVFNVASRVAAIMLFPLMATTSILAPKFAAMHRNGQRAELAQLSRQSSALLMALAIPAVVIMFFSAEWILRIFGAEFVTGVWVLRLLLLGILVNVSTGALGELLVMTGNERITKNLNTLGAIFIVVLCFILIPLYGGIGAAISVTSGYTFLNLIMVLCIKKYLGFWPVGLKT